MNRAICRTYQLGMKAAMKLVPWHTPEVTEGPGSISKAGEILKAKNLDRVLIVTGKHVGTSGILDGMITSLDEAGIFHCMYMGDSNPTDKNVEEGLGIFTQNSCNALIAVGGGSPMDCCKAIGARVARPKKNVEQMQGLFKVIKPIPDIIAIPTTAGTGSETTIAAVIIDSETKHKASMTDPSLMPKDAILDPELTMSLPPQVTATTGIDALCHAVEAYTNHTYNSKTEDEMCKKAVKLIYENLYTAYEDGANLDARQNMQKAAFYAGRAFTRGCVGYVHAIAHTLSGLYGTAHGEAIAIVLPHVMRAYGKSAHEYLAELAEVCGMRGISPEVKAHKFIAWIEEMKQKMQIPKHANCIRSEDIDKMVEWALKEGNPLYPVPEIWGRAKFKACIQKILG